jgi:lipopolysaccharide export system protein LptA
MSKTFLPIMPPALWEPQPCFRRAAPAQVIRNHNSNAPVDFDAGAIELQDRADRVILTGGVTATQAGLTMRASRVTAAYSSNGGIDVNRLDAVGRGDHHQGRSARDQ